MGRSQAEARDDDIVLARIGTDVTLTRLECIDAETVELRPRSAKPEHEAVRVGPRTDNFEIVGVEVAAIVGATLNGPTSAERGPRQNGHCRSSPGKSNP